MHTNTLEETQTLTQGNSANLEKALINGTQLTREMVANT